MSIIFNQAIMNEFGMTYSQTVEADPNDHDNDYSITTTVTRVSCPQSPYFIIFTDTFTNYGVGECYFIVFPDTTSFLVDFFEEEQQELFKLSQDEYSRLEGRTLHFEVKYFD